MWVALGWLEMALHRYTCFLPWTLDSWSSALVSRSFFVCLVYLVVSTAAFVLKPSPEQGGLPGQRAKCFERWRG